MAGHSKFKKIKHKKEAADQKRSKVYTSVARELTVAARIGGGDPSMNPRLRLAMLSAKQANYPKGKIEEAIKRGVNPLEGDVLEEVTYEGFGPSGVALMVEAVVASKQLLPEKSVVKKSFAKNGGTLGSTGCVAHLFQRMGLITYPVEVKPEDDMFDLALDHGADDCEKVENEYEILCSFEKLHAVSQALEKSLGEPSGARPIWKPNNPVVLDHENTKKILTFIEELEDIESVQDVWSNLDVPNDFNPDAP